VHSATRPEIYSPTFGAPGRGLGVRFSLVFPAQHHGPYRRASWQNLWKFLHGGGGCIFYAAELWPSDAWCCSHAPCTAAHARVGIPDSNGGYPRQSALCGQRTIAPLAQPHGFARGYEEVARRRRSPPWRGALWLGQTQASIVLASARSIYLRAHVLSKDCPDWRSVNEAQPQTHRRKCAGPSKGTRRPAG
jgi:hypothetical protein